MLSSGSEDGGVLVIRAALLSIFNGFLMGEPTRSKSACTALSSAISNANMHMDVMVFTNKKLESEKCKLEMGSMAALPRMIRRQTPVS